MRKAPGGRPSLPVQARKKRRPPKKKQPPYRKYTQPQNRPSSSPSSDSNRHYTPSASGGSSSESESGSGSGSSEGGSDSESEESSGESHKEPDEEEGSGEHGGAEDEEDEGTADYKKGGYHPVSLGDVFSSRYTIVSKVGWGHFSTVWRAHDTNLNKDVAMKIVKSAHRYTEAARDEIEILNVITNRDPLNSMCCCHLLDNFQHHGPNGVHTCMVFELLGSNLLDLIKLYHYKGIPIPIVKYIARQILVGLNYLHTTCKLIHTDLKPENVLLWTKIEPELHKITATVCEEALSTRSAKVATETSLPTSATPTSTTTTAATTTIVVAPSSEPETTPSTKEPTATQPPDPSAPSRQQRPAPPQQQRAQNSPKKNPNTKPNKGAQKSPQKVPQKNVSAASATQTTSSSATNEETCASPVAPPASVPELLSRFNIKIVDFGNGAWIHKRFTNDIQTRQYRAPEVILRGPWDTSADMWSLACMVFELITGDLLFTPKASKSFTKEDDHLAQMIELLGPIPQAQRVSGRRCSEFFNARGFLRHISSLRMWPLEKVLFEKYKLDKAEADLAASFMVSMMNYDKGKRATAAQALQHPWLAGVPVPPPFTQKNTP
ncbi:CMGC SRPK kinase [Pelomyxa schiedti]|nr:CMGC SRPK kinase [Pelomyxa schiedti]